VTVIAPTALYVNGQDTARLGFVVDGLSGIFDGVTRSDVLVDLPQGAGSVLSSVPGRTATRDIVIDGTLPATSRAGLEAAKHQLKALCGPGTVQLRLVSQGFVFYARLTGIQITHFTPQLTERRSAARVSLRFQCADPQGYDLAPQLVGFGSTPVAMPLGTAPSRGRSSWGAVITILGPATTPTLRELDAAQNIKRSMAFTWSPTANDAIIIDLAKGLVTRRQSGTDDNGLSYLSAGWEFPRLDPADGDYSTSAFPHLSVTSGVGVARYHRSWL
jgi:hypothetical protein